MTGRRLSSAPTSIAGGLGILFVLGLVRGLIAAGRGHDPTAWFVAAICALAAALAVAFVSDVRADRQRYRRRS